MKPSLTIYPQTEATFRSALSPDDIDRNSFRRPIKQCDINKCKGMCCYDGVYLNEEEADVINSLWQSEAPFFAEQGLDVSLPPVVDGSWGVHQGRKTRLIPRRFSETVSNFPTFFSNTACVFLNANGYCSLQLLGVARNKHPWFFKPITCSLHPISVSLRASRVYLPTDENDPHRQGDYLGYISQTQCGQMCATGRPAAEILAEELAFLERILEADC